MSGRFSPPHRLSRAPDWDEYRASFRDVKDSPVSKPLDESGPHAMVPITHAKADKTVQIHALAHITATKVRWATDERRSKVRRISWPSMNVDYQRQQSQSLARAR
jgi:hypothetical protein